MSRRNLKLWMVSTMLLACSAPLTAQPAEPAEAPPARIYVPYEKLQDVLGAEEQGVFMPYSQFERLWRSAQGKPATVESAPADYLVSTARFTGQVGEKLARLELLLTVDILADGWVQVPLSLSPAGAPPNNAPQARAAAQRPQFAVSDASWVEAPDQDKPLLRLIGGQYYLLVNGKGRRVVKIEFVSQLISEPGKNVLTLPVPPASISTLDLLIPEQNVQVDINPILAATTSTVQQDGKEMTRLQAFLGGAGRQVQLTWQPRTQAAEQLAAVIIADQRQTIEVTEAVIKYEVTFDYDIRRQGVDTFDIQLPGDFRVIAVNGNNLSRWELQQGGAEGDPQVLNVKLFSPAEGSYKLTVRMERFLKESQLKLPLTPIFTRQVLRRTGLIGITQSRRRSVEVVDANDQLVRVDVGRLGWKATPEGTTAWRFVSADYAAALDIDTIEPRLSVTHNWLLNIRPDAMELAGQLHYTVSRAGIFSLKLQLPEPWEGIRLEPESIVDDFEFTGQGADRVMNITLRSEREGTFSLNLTARASRSRPDADVNFQLPLAGAENLTLYRGQVLVNLAESLRAEISQIRQLNSIPVRQVNSSLRSRASGGLSAAMGFSFISLDRQQAEMPGLDLAIAVKPAQVSAVVHRLANIQAGSVQHEAVIDFTVRYAPVRTFYLTMPPELGDAELQIDGENIQETPRIDALPADQMPENELVEANDWIYHKIVLQSPLIGSYRLKVSWRQGLQLTAEKVQQIRIQPVMAAGKISDQSAEIAIAKGATLAVGIPEFENLTPADPTSSRDLTYAPHRGEALLAFTSNSPPYQLTLPVRLQQEAEVITTIVDAALIEQVLGRDGTLNAKATYLISTSRGDRLAVTYPEGATVYPPLLDGQEVAMESASGNTRLIRLPHSAGQVNRFLLELPYGLSEVEAGSMQAPSLPDQVPVQRTWWQVWVPEDQRLLHFDSSFARLEGPLPDLGRLVDRNLPAEVRQLPTQGVALAFVKQGQARQLDVTVMDRTIFVGLVGVVILLAGAALLLVGGFVRGLALLGGALLVALIWLPAPLLAASLARAAIVPVLLVLGLWALHALFFSLLPAWRAGRQEKVQAEAVAVSAGPVSQDNSKDKE